jgi:NAD(P)-dependent dehydrogenase (short-subunit alcohol dehydrogenase family)
MSMAVVTGAHRGIGLALARQYAAEGWSVVATYLPPADLTALETSPGSIRSIPLDVTDLAAVTAFGAELKDEAVDVLVANAGIFPGVWSRPDAIDLESWWQTIRVNAIGALACAGCLYSAVARSSQKKMVAISSKVGSIGLDQRSPLVFDMQGEYVYRSSKAALNAVWRTFAFSHPDVIAISMSPGYVRTDMQPNGTITTDESATGIRRVIAELRPGDSGTFRDYKGDIVPW